ncbi:MAG TPA: GlsB/YeaQ/YmgE family stress response membrane protein [Jiangellales bacterium]|nr:GlsB/YeaQ/YmgE family stress response membrane protein [Jiangellales bacterium]
MDILLADVWEGRSRAKDPFAQLSATVHHPRGKRDMGIIGWIVLGLLAGAIAKLIMPGKDPGGIIITMLVGIVGALLGGFLASVLFDINVNDEFFDLATWISAIAGALILLLLYRLFTGRRSGARV